jgi:hypothetical protein
MLTCAGGIDRSQAYTERRSEAIGMHLRLFAGGVRQRTDRRKPGVDNSNSTRDFERSFMTIKHSLSALAFLVLGMAASHGAMANKLGTLGTTPSVQTLRLEEQDLSFTSHAFFSVVSDAWLSVAAQPSRLSLGGDLVLGIDHFTLQVLDSAHTLIQSATASADGWSIDKLSLAAGRYEVAIGGDTVGSMGGLVAWSLVAKAQQPGDVIEVIIPSVPEPSTLVLSLFGLLPLIGVRRWSRTQGQAQVQVAMV